jgi:hypothetical protein
MNAIKFARKFALPLFVALAYAPAQALAVTPLLESAGSFAVLAGSGVTNTGPTVLTGNLGTSPTPAITGFFAVDAGPGLVVGGTIHAADAVALQAQTDLTTAYNFLAGEAVTSNLTGQNLGGLTLTSGVYFFASSAQLTGNLILDAQNNANATWTFQIGSTLTTASASSVSVINGFNNATNGVFWQVGSSATLGTTTSFLGNIVALTSIGLNTGANISCGSALARNGAVTLDTNHIGTGCGGGFSVAPGTGVITPVPEPETYAMLLSGLGLMGFVARRRQRNLAAAA